MTIQQIIERLLRSRLYRIGVVLELDTGEVRQGLVTELVYDGSNSVVVVDEPSRPRIRSRLRLASIASVALEENPDAA